MNTITEPVSVDQAEVQGDESSLANKMYDWNWLR